MIQVQEVNVSGKDFEFLKMEIGNAPLLMLKSRKGYVMCGYLNLETAEKLGDAAVRVTGVKDLDSFLMSKPVAVSSKARELGIRDEQTVSEFLHLL